MLLSASPQAWASGPQQGARVLAVASDARAENLDLLRAYGQARAIPAGQRCVLSGLPDAIAQVAARTITADDYASGILAPVLDCLSSADDPGAIDFIVVMRGMPHHVTGDGWQASLEALLTVGDTTVDGAPLWSRSAAIGGRPTLLSPLYEAFVVYDLVTELRGGRFPEKPSHAALAESGPDQVLEITADGVAGVGPVAWDIRPAYRLDGGSDEGTRSLIDRSIASDFTAPDGVWMCMGGADPARGVRDRECGRALDLLEDRFGMRVARPPWTPDLAPDEPVIAYLTGAADLRGAIDGVTYLPGALTDNITSFGAVPQNWSYDEDGESQTSIVRFLQAGASSTHGTSAEPLNGAFASAGLMVLYAQGYTMGEAYALSLPYLRWMNVPVGDPLMGPYVARPPFVDEAGEGEGEVDGQGGAQDPPPTEEPPPIDQPPPPPPGADPGPVDDPVPGSDGGGGAGDGGCVVGQGLPSWVMRR